MKPQLYTLLRYRGCLDMSLLNLRERGNILDVT